MVQVLIITGILSAVIGGFLTMMGSTLKVQKNITLTDDLQNSLAVVRTVLSKTDVCSANLSNLSGLTFSRTALPSTHFTLNRIRNLSGTETFLQNGQPLPGKPGTLVTMEVRNFAEIIPNKTYRAEIVFKLDKDSGGIGSVLGARSIVRTMPISFDVINPGGTTQQIQSCSVFQSTALTIQETNTLKSEVCTSMGGVWDATTGNCTLPTPTPVPTPNVALLKSELCRSMGGTWNATTQACALPVAPPAPTPDPNVIKAQMCASMGGSWNAATLSCSLVALVPTPAPPPAAWTPSPSGTVMRVDRTGCGTINVVYADGRVDPMFIVACGDGGI